MAEIRKVVRSAPLSNFRQAAPSGGFAFDALAQVAQQAYDFVAPLAVDQLTQEGYNQSREDARRFFGTNQPAGPSLEWQTGQQTPNPMRDPNEPPVATSAAAPAVSTSLLGLIDRTEGAGRYDTLFGHSQIDGPFAGVDVSQMTLGQLADFASPSGEYGNWVAGQVGRVATPMGRYQIVGTTLRNAAEELGLGPDTLFNAETQDYLAAHLASRRLSGARTMEGKIAALRSEWEGFQSVPDSTLAAAIQDFERNGLTPPRQGSTSLSGDAGQDRLGAPMANLTAEDIGQAATFAAETGLAALILDLSQQPGGEELAREWTQAVTAAPAFPTDGVQVVGQQGQASAAGQGGQAAQPVPEDLLARTEALLGIERGRNVRLVAGKIAELRGAAGGPQPSGNGQAQNRSPFADLSAEDVGQAAVLAAETGLAALILDLNQQPGGEELAREWAEIVAAPPQFPTDQVQVVGQLGQTNRAAAGQSPREPETATGRQGIPDDLIARTEALLGAERGGNVRLIAQRLAQMRGAAGGPEPRDPLQPGPTSPVSSNQIPFGNGGQFSPDGNPAWADATGYVMASGLAALLQSLPQDEAGQALGAEWIRAASGGSIPPELIRRTEAIQGAAGGPVPADPAAPLRGAAGGPAPAEVAARLAELRGPAGGPQPQAPQQADPTLVADVRSALAPQPSQAPEPAFMPETIQPPPPTLVRTASGRLEGRMFPPNAGPLLQAYNAAYKMGVLAEASVAVRSDLLNLSTSYRSDPDGFLSAARQYADERVANIDPQLRIDLRTQMDGEIESRYLGLIDERNTEIRQRADNSNAALIDLWSMDYADALASGNQEAIGLARGRLQSALTAREAIPGIAWTPENSLLTLRQAEERAQSQMQSASAAARQGNEDSLRAIIAARKEGMTGADEGILDNPATWQMNPDLAQEAASWVEFGQAMPGFLGLPPAEQQAQINALRAEPVQDAYQVQMVKNAEEAMAASRRAWEADPVAHAAATLPVPPPPLPSFDAANPQPFYEAVRARNQYGLGLQQAGYVQSPVFLTNQEAADFGLLLSPENPTDVRLGLAVGIAEAFGPNAGLVFRQVGQDDPIIRFAGSMIASNPALAPVAHEALRGDELLATRQAEAPDAVVLPPEIAGTMTALPSQITGDIAKVARAIIATRYNTDRPSPSQVKEAVQSALGQSYRPSDNATVGGVQTVLGQPVLLPPTISGDQLNEALRSAFGVTGIAPDPLGMGGGRLPLTQQIFNPTGNASPTAAWVQASTFPNRPGSMPYAAGEPLPSSMMNRLRLRVSPRDGNYYFDVVTDRGSTPVTDANGVPLPINLDQLIAAAQ